MLLLIIGAFLLPPVLNPATLILIGSGDLAPAIAWALMASWALLVLFGLVSYLRLVMWVLDPGPGKAITPARRVGICVFLAICAAYMMPWTLDLYLPFSQRHYWSPGNCC